MHRTMLAAVACALAMGTAPALADRDNDRDNDRFSAKLSGFEEVGGLGAGQTGAILMGLGRALAKYDQALEVPLRNAGYLTRDSRMKERKKYGQRGARRRFQFSKR